MMFVAAGEAGAAGPPVDRKACRSYLVKASWAIVLIATAFLLSTPHVGAVPYACNLTNANGVISFRLNANADRVWLIWPAGQSTNDLGPLEAGLHQVTMDVVDTFQVAVLKTNPVSYAIFRGNHQPEALQISSDTNQNACFFSPRGIAVNTDPTSPWFGRVYVANSQVGTVTNVLTGAERSTGDGLYALNSDLTDALGQGDSALTGGLPMTNSDRAPFRLSLGKAGELYVCDASEASGNLYSVDGDLGSGTMVLGGSPGGSFPVGSERVHGAILSAVVIGSLAETNLTAFVIDEDLQLERESTFRSMLNSLWRHDLGSTLPPPASPPTLLVEAPWFSLAAQVMDLSRSTNGYFYVNDYRVRGTDRAGLYVHDADGQPLWNSLSATRSFLNNAGAADLLAATGGGCVSDEYQLAAAMNQDTGMITMLPLVDGLPELSRRMTFPAFPLTNSGACDVAFDLVGNLYVLSSAAKSLRVFSPGGITKAITGSDGTFQLLRTPQLAISSKPFAVEGQHAAFVVHRGGDTNVPVSFTFHFEGTALDGIDYVQTNIELSATIPPGVTDFLIPFLPLADEVDDAPVTLICILHEGTDYDLVVSSSAACELVDSPELQVTAVDASAYEDFPNDRILFEVRRIGETNSTVEVSYDLGNSTATYGFDFDTADGLPLTEVLRLAAGQTNLFLAFVARDEPDVEGPESIVLRLLPSDTYRLGEAVEATAWIWDDDPVPLPAGSLLFADNFDVNTESEWVVRFGANNNIYDAEILWAFDYSQLWIPRAPNSDTFNTLGLFVQVNGTNNTDGGSAGINLYPKNHRFTGDFSLRFDVFINAGLFNPDEHLLTGLNHSGDYTNRLTRSPDPLGTTRGGDGVWFTLAIDPNDEAPCAAYTVPTFDAFPQQITNRSSASLAEVFPAPPYRLAGSPAVLASTGGAWTQVELNQLDGVIELKLNSRTALSFTNNTGFNNGTIMIGFNDQFDSLGNSGPDGSYAVFDNVRVINLQPAVQRIEVLEPIEVAIYFSAPGAKSVDEVQVQASTLLTSDWQDVPAVITVIPDGFRAVVPKMEGPQFYRVLRRKGG